MEKRELINIIDKILIRLGFIKENNHWIFFDDIIKIVYLKKSNFGNVFFIDYGYILNSVPLENLNMHIFNRISSSDVTENARINELLNIGNDIPNGDRLAGLEMVLNEKLGKNFLLIKSEDDLLCELKKRKHLNDIPLSVKKHFNLEL